MSNTPAERTACGVRSALIVIALVLVGFGAYWLFRDRSPAEIAAAQKRLKDFRERGREPRVASRVRRLRLVRLLCRQTDAQPFPAQRERCAS